MKEKYSYDALNKKLEELSVPDEEQSWQKMKALLDKEKKDRILPPFFLNCAGWTLLILLTAGGIFIFWPSGKDNSISKADSVETKKSETVEMPQTPQAKTSSDSGTSSDNGTSSESGTSDQVFSVPLENKDYKNPGDKNEKNSVIKLNNKEGNKWTASNSRMLSRLKKTKKERPQPITYSPTNKALTQNVEDTAVENNIDIKMDSVYSPINEALTQTIKDTTSENSIVVKKDSGEINDSSTLRKTDEDSLVSEKNLDQKKQKTPNFYFAAGLSVQQQLPLDGQSLNSYSVNGRKSSLADYLPAIYLRLYKENKWFVQAGFRYGAPQPTKELLYRSTTTRDNVRRTTTFATLRLKKTFYNQLPLSFNYSLLPNLSIGAGGMYSRFEAAVSEIELRVRNNQTNAETVTRDVMKVPSNTDPVFTASQWHCLLQGEYSRKKWGVGFRYTGGLQPFIRYVELGLTKEEKNHSLQVFLRYDFLKRKL